jgi:DNA repair protein RecO (recombination protein O)
MEWSDEAVIVAVRPHGETAAVVELLTRTHGRHAGLVHGGRSRTARPVLQIGNHVSATWKARLSDQLGHMSLDLTRGYAASAMNEPLALAGLNSLCALARTLPERDPHPNLYEITLFVLGFFDEPSVWPALYVRWELALLQELGFGLDLTSCAATEVTKDLCYVSPKSGRAVSRLAGAPYHDRMLALPTFLTADRPTGANAIVTSGDIAAGLGLTGHFLNARVFQPRELTIPDARSRLVDLLLRQTGP